MGIDAKTTYGHRLRVRVCGLTFRDNKILMVKHRGLGRGHLWIPPGGGAEFGQDLHGNLTREFKEEAGLDIKVGDFLFTFELLDQPLHTLEMFFEVSIVGGELVIGKDPEHDDADQLIEDVKFMTFEEVISEGDNVHQIFSLCNSFDDLLALRGYFKFQK